MIIFLFHVIFLFQNDLPLVLSTYDQNANAIIIFAKDNRSDLYAKSITSLTKDPIGLDERNIVIFEIFTTGGIGPGGESLTTEQVTSIRQYYTIDSGDFSEILVSGSFKEIFRSDVPIEIKEIFRNFDEVD
jgi:hypothetical protein